MNSPIRTVMLAALAAGLLAAAPAIGADMSVIDKRTATMKDVVLKNFQVVKNFAQKGQGTAADVGKAADALVAIAPKIPPLFPKGTGRPDVDAKKTRAKAEIWTDWKGFEAAAMALGTEAAKLSKVATSGDKEAIKAQFAITGKKGCGGCHKTFRGAKVK